MPVMDGLNTLGYIMSECPTPCVMISAFTEEGTKESIKALEYGAVELIKKPGGVISPDIEDISAEIISKVKLASTVPVKKLKFIIPFEPERSLKAAAGKLGLKRVFVIASSTGGTQALAYIIPKLRTDLEAAILVVQHMPEGFTKSLADRLNWQSKVPVVEAEDKMPIRAGHVILAKGGFHMEVAGTADSAHIVLTEKPLKNGVRPAADHTMTSAAKVFGGICVGIVLTGMGSDGTEGSAAIKERGGRVLAQDETSCVVFGMPRSVIQAGIADKVVPLKDVVDEMERTLKGE
jgi:two-component system chemotaxis response regulator CheB